MQRTITITASSDLIAALTGRLRDLDGVLALSVHAGAGVKPAGDVLIAEVLNRGTDDVLRTAQEVLSGAEGVVVTSDASSASLTRGEQPPPKDVDESLWEEMETALRHNGQVTTNFLLLIAVGGAVAACGLVLDPVNRAIAFVAAAVIAPGFEPVAMVPLGLTLRRWKLVRDGLLSAAIGYLFLVASAGFTLWTLFRLGAADPGTFTSTAEGLVRPTLVEVIVSALGAGAGVVMVTAGRSNVIAGALIAMALIPVSAAIGGALVTGQTDIALHGLKRLALDIGFVVFFGVVITALKQALVHRRQPIG